MKIGTPKIYDVIIFGGGITGLLTAQKLSEIGLKVALVERQATLAAGPSTRNEGWLHRGTYHACSIKDRETAIQVAKRCIYGHRQLKRFAPEAVEDDGARPFALLKDQAQIDEITSRWDEAGVSYRFVTKTYAQNRVTDAELKNASAIFEVDDCSINTRLLYRKLLHLASFSGCDFFIGHKIDRFDGATVLLLDGAGDLKRVTARKFIFACGYGVREIFLNHFNVSLPVRYWKSHLVITRRLASHGIFFLDANEAAMMHHGDKSIIGFNEDALLCPEPGYDVIPDRAENLRAAICRLFPGCDLTSAQDVACTKVDLVQDRQSARSLSIAVEEPLPGHICILPGKMTEAPYLTDILTARLHESLDEPMISMRPCDQLQMDSAVRGAA